MRKTILSIIITVFIIPGYSCKSKEKELARKKGIEAAVNLLNTDKEDQMALQNCILEAKTAQSEYIIAGDTVTAIEFEKAYVEYIENHDAQLAKEMF